MLSLHESWLMGWKKQWIWAATIHISNVTCKRSEFSSLWHEASWSEKKPQVHIGAAMTWPWGCVHFHAFFWALHWPGFASEFSQYRGKKNWFADVFRRNLAARCSWVFCASSWYFFLATQKEPIASGELTFCHGKWPSRNSGYFPMKNGGSFHGKMWQFTRGYILLNPIKSH